MWLVVTDAHSKWLEVVVMNSTTAGTTVKVLRDLFACHGIPEQLVSDNGLQFITEEFRHFLLENGIKHLRCAPYHLASNGVAERFVQTVKRALKAGSQPGVSLGQTLSAFLL